MAISRRSMLERLISARRNNREVQLEDLYSGMLFELRIHPEKEIISCTHDLNIRYFEVDFVPSIREIIGYLKERYSFAVISNAISNTPGRALERVGLDKYFRCTVISRDISIRKSDPEIFRFTLICLGFDNNQVFHVEDSLEHDVCEARNAGLKTIWIGKNQRVDIMLILQSIL